MIQKTAEKHGAMCMVVVNAAPEEPMGEEEGEKVEGKEEKGEEELFHQRACSCHQSGACNRG